MKVLTTIVKAALTVLLFAAAGAGAQPPRGDTASPPAVSAGTAPMWPGADYDPAIPALRDVLGHEPGERIVGPAEALRYLEALAAAAPSRLRIVEYGRTWENRPLVYVVVGSERNLLRLDAIRAGMASLADPRRTTAAEAEALIGDLPAVVWLAYGVHGDEISSTDAALLSAYHLLAARGDELVDSALAGALVVLDPSQNPDGRARFVHHHRGAVGLRPSAHPQAFERDQPWPGGRSNHYLFDLNRDWFALTQPETRARVRAALDWYPLVYVDLHEMGAESSYFFPPNAPPANPHLTASQEAAFELFGRNNAHWFDRFGFDYFTREVFDYFYPGYGDSWGSFHGAIGMTYETASARGLVVRRPDAALLTYRDGVRRHFVATLATVETAALNRERLLRDFWAFRSSAIEEGRRGTVREHVLPWRGDTSLVAELAALLVEQGVEVRRSSEPLTACRQELPAGSFFVSTAQPASRLARTLLEPQANMEDEFVREQERRRRKGLPHEMYDVTAWSLPLLYGVEQLACGEAVRESALAPVARAEGAAGAPLAPPAIAPAAVAASSDAVAYLVPWGAAAAGRFLIAALDAGIPVLGADKGFTLGGRAYPRGTLIVKGGDDAEALGRALAGIAAATGAEVIASATSWVDEGIGFGSDRVVALRRPEVALAWDRPTSSIAAGAVRWVLERRYGLGVTTLRTVRVGDADLDDFDVVVLPDGADYGGVLGEAGKRNLERFVEDGGVLIAIAGAVSYVGDPKVGLLSVREETRAPAADPAAAEDAPPPASNAVGTAASAPSGSAPAGSAPAASAAGAAAGATSSGAAAGADEDATIEGTVLAGEADYLAAIAGEKEPPDVVPGAIVRAVPDPDHWLTVGLPPTVNVMIEGSSIFTPLRLDQGTNALRFAPADELLAAGYLWDENRRQLAFKPFAVVEARGRGLVIGFTADPTFRGFLAGLDVLFLNAVVRAPAHVER